MRFTSTIQTIVRALALCAFASAPLVAWGQSDDVINADRPGLADGSMTIRRGTTQIEVGVERDDQRIDGATQRGLATPALVRYGMTDALEMRIETAGYRRFNGGGETSDGWSPVSIGMKVHLQEEDAKSHKPSLGIIGRLFVPSGSGDFRGDSATGDLRLAADLDLTEHWSLNPNVGVAFLDDNGRFTAALAALTVTCNITQRFNVFVDGGFQAPEQPGGTAYLLLDTGTAWIIGRDLQFDATIGWGAHGSTPPQVMFAAGVSRRF